MDYQIEVWKSDYPACYPWRFSYTVRGRKYISTVQESCATEYHTRSCAAAMARQTLERTYAAAFEAANP